MIAPFQSPGIASDYDSIHQSDIATIGRDQNYIWINGTRPTAVDIGNMNMPNNTFPFARLASVTTPDQSITYLYHQMNGTTFAEEEWVESVADWGPPTYITVLPS